MGANARLPFTLLFVVALAAAGAAAAGLLPRQADPPPPASVQPALTIRQDDGTGAIAVFREAGGDAILTQHAPAEMRPYVHPIAAPDGRGVLTEVSPDHHRHQTGLYWGFTRLNGRDYFHNPGAGFWRRVSATVLDPRGDAVRWETVYDLLDEAGAAVLRETQRWSMRVDAGRYVLDLDWRGAARTPVTVGRYDYGGLFLRMPWRAGIPGEVVNAARQRNERAEGQRAMWIDVGMQVDGRDDLAHIAIFDHPTNRGYPQAWRVDGQLGVGAARSRDADWTIPAGETELIRHRFIVYTGALNDVDLTDAWTAFSGSGGLYSTSALWGIAQREGREAAFLTPEQAVAAMTLAPGYTVTAWAAEPAIAQPMAFCWDDRGRLWVAENRDYENRERGFANSGDSRIVILEDTDRDGVADRRTVFLEGIPFPSAIAVGFDGLFLGAPPHLLFVPDRDGDDRADVEAIEIRLTGWGIRDRHETINSLHWGPDGWLYGLQGYATPSRVRKPDASARLYRHGELFPDDILEGEGTDINGGVWRYHPTKDVFEVVAHGFSNPWGIDHDAKGQLLITACVIPHLWHVIPGGIYHRQGGQHFNPYVYGDLQTIADHRHRSAHGGARVYLSDAFPASQHGRMFMANIHEHAVLSDVLVRRGSGFTAHHGEDFLLANNAQWIGFSMEIGPEGALYVLDWHDADICGQDVLHKETGRIFRIAPEASGAEDWEGRYADLRRMTDAQLVELQTRRSAWHARRARLILQHRAFKETLEPRTHDRLREMFLGQDNPDWRLRAMWALHVTGGWRPGELVRALEDRDEYVRAWAVQLLGEDGPPPAPVLETFARMARSDRSPVVRLYLASALQRLDPAARWPIASELVLHEEDAADHNIPTMIWLGVEPLAGADPPRALQLAHRSRIPLVARFTARRAADAGALEAVAAAIAAAPPAQQASLLEGMRDALEGRYDVEPPPGWAALSQRLAIAGPPAADLVKAIGQAFGDADATRRNLASLRNGSAAVEGRRRAVQVLAAQRRPQLVPELPAALADRDLRIEAIRAIAAFDDEGLGRLLIEQYGRFTPEERIEAVQTLASRRRYGRLLTEALSKGVVAKRDVPVHVARQLIRVVGASFTDVYGPVERSASERAQARYRALLTDTALAGADLANGRAIYARTCGACHTLYGEGGTLGPDITGSNRANLDYLLFNVLEPNAEVQDAYKMVVISTRDGRTLSGTVTAETDRQITLQVAGGAPVVITKAAVQSREVTDVSMMPPGLFDALADDEIVDLVGYLRTAEPLP